MANQDEKKPSTRPAEDMFGRPTSPRHAEPASRSERDASVQDNTGSLKSTEEEEEGEARHSTGVDEIPDGDGPRSDRGTNPLPETYWADFPGGKP